MYGSKSRAQFERACSVFGHIVRLLQVVMELDPAGMAHLVCILILSPRDVSMRRVLMLLLRHPTLEY